MLSFLKNNKLQRVSNAVAAGSTDSNGSSVDMKDFESVTFVASYGALTASAVTGLKAQQSSDDGVSDGWSDIEGTAQSIADSLDNDCLALEVIRPTKRYVRPVVTRATANAVIDGVLAILSHPRKAPVTHDSATIAGTEVHVSPAEGTA